MANVANAFSALLGSGESQAASSSKKKNKAKAKQPAEQSAGASAAVTVAAPSSAPFSNGHAKAEASVVDVPEATAILERAAREAKAIGDKCRLWKEWARQVCTCCYHAAPPVH